MNVAMNTLYLIPFFVFVCLSQSHAQNAEMVWGGCVDPRDPGATVTKGEPTTVCLIVADGLDWTRTRMYMRLSFQPTVDQISRFEIPNSHEDLYSLPATRVSDLFIGRNTTVHVASQTSFSFQKRYFDGFERVFPYLTVVIHVQDGVVSDVTWDDAGIFCDENSTNPVMYDYSGLSINAQEVGYPVHGCWVARDMCESGSFDCDLALNVVWTGTDSKGETLQSFDCLLKGGSISSIKSVGADLGEASRIGADFRGVLFVSDPRTDPSGGEPLPFSSQQFADMTDDDLSYLDTIRPDGEEILDFPERQSSASSGPASISLVVETVRLLLLAVACANVV